MSPDPNPASVLEIKKYPNRRLYDATRSCHVTTGELYDLVAGGRTVRVRDSKSGEDLTNQILLQALIERDPLKINAVPPPLIHMMIRMNQQMMASWFDLFMRWTMEGYRSAGRASPAAWWGGWPSGGSPWSGSWAPPGWTGAGGPAGSALSPTAWLETFLRTAGAPMPGAGGSGFGGPGFGGPGFGGPPPPTEAYEPDDVEPEPGPEDEPDDDLALLRRQVADLAEEIARMRSEREESD